MVSIFAPYLSFPGPFFRQNFPNSSTRREGQAGDVNAIVLSAPCLFFAFLVHALSAQGEKFCWMANLKDADVQAFLLNLKKSCSPHLATLFTLMLETRCISGSALLRIFCHMSNRQAHNVRPRMAKQETSKMKKTRTLLRFRCAAVRSKIRFSWCAKLDDFPPAAPLTQTLLEK